MRPDLDCVCLLIACLNLLDKDTKNRITRFLDHHLLDRSLHQMMFRGFFPGWFSDSFCYDPLHSWLGGLRECLAFASANLLLRMDGTNFYYHPDLTGDTISRLLGEIPFNPQEAQALGRELSRSLLHEQVLDRDFLR